MGGSYTVTCFTCNKSVGQFNWSGDDDRDAFASATEAEGDHLQSNYAHDVRTMKLEDSGPDPNDD